MVPLKDNLPTERLALVTLLLIAANALVYVVADGVSLLQTLSSVYALWLFGPALEDSMTAWRFLALCLLGAGATLGACALLGSDTLLDADAAVAMVGMTGAAGAVLGGYALLYPGARLVSVVFVPPFVGLVEMPALVMLALWVALQGLFALTSLGGDAAASLAPLAGFAFGLLAIGAFVQQRKPVPPRAAGRTLA